MLKLLLFGLLRSASSEWCVVTGASSGIGEHLALQAAEGGYDVVLHGRRRGALHRLKKAIEAQYPSRSTKMVVEDLATQRGAQRVHAACKGLDVRLLFSNAGVARVQPVVDDDGIDVMLALNVRASTELCRRFGRDMAEAGGGRVVLTASLVGVPAHGCAGAAAYAASKAYLRSFGNALHDELTPRGVSVTTVLPGAVDTPFAKTAGMDEGRSLVFSVPGGRLLGVVSAPDAVARAAHRAAARKRREVVPGLANKAYALTAELLPNVVGRVVAKATFAPPPRRLGPRSAAFIAAPASRSPTPPKINPPPRAISASAVGYGLLGVVGGLSVANALQDGWQTPLATPPPYATKADFYSAWRASAAPDASALPGSVWDGEVLFLGALAPVGSLVTHKLFPVRKAERKWLGKQFDRRGAVGTNRFPRGDDEEVLGRDFSWSISKSRRDGAEALVLNYAAAPTPDRLFGTVLRMRDELRELEPGVLLGIGSMAATGGMLNGAPFILRLRPSSDDAESAQEALLDDARAAAARRAERESR